MWREKIMSLKEMTKEELEVLSYTDLTYMLLKENKKTMTTPAIFKLICDLLDYTDEEYASKIGDYYTSLTIDKRFVLLDNAEWDIRDNHKIDVVVEDDDEEDIEESEEIDAEEVSEDEELDVEEEINSIDDDLDDVDDDLDDLAIIDDEDAEEE